MSIDYDILIIGGGMVGASLARSLSGQGFRIGVVEAFPYTSDSQPSYDDRVLALSWGSRLILQGMGLWEGLEAEVEPIGDIHISDRGHFGFTRLNHRQEGVDALGYVVTAKVLGKLLLKGLDKIPDIELLCPARLESFRIKESDIGVSLEQSGAKQSVSTRLLVAADGSNSRVRQLLSIPYRESSYGQTAIIANVSPERAHGGTAYERFTDSGPLAMLPMSEGRCSLVWTARDEQVPELMALADADFLTCLQDRFGFRLGRLQRVGSRVAYPLRLLQVKEQVRPRIALIGNAAHALHPVTGQGFNLGLRDVAALADILSDVGASKGDPGDLAHLQGYADWRRQDQNQVTMITDSLARLFANPWPPLRMARNLGLVSLDLMPGLKHQVARQFMGLNGKLPRLSRGLPLV